MILFKITSCPDKSQIGIYQHENSSLIIGSVDADMIIDDPDIAEQQLEIRLEDDGFVVENLYPKVEVKLNGTKLGKKAVPIKANDSLAMASTQIFVTKLDDSPLEPPEVRERDTVAMRLQSPDSPEGAILEALEFLSGSENTLSTRVGKGTAVPPPLPKKKGR